MQTVTPPTHSEIWALPPSDKNCLVLIDVVSRDVLDAETRPAAILLQGISDNGLAADRACKFVDHRQETRNPAWCIAEVFCRFHHKRRGRWRVVV